MWRFCSFFTSLFVYLLRSLLFFALAWFGRVRWGCSVGSWDRFWCFLVRRTGSSKAHGVEGDLQIQWLAGEWHKGRRNGRGEDGVLWEKKLMSICSQLRKLFVSWTWTSILILCSCTSLHLQSSPTCGHHVISTQKDERFDQSLERVLLHSLRVSRQSWWSGFWSLD